jgi:hypothetical protein
VKQSLWTLREVGTKEGRWAASGSLILWAGALRGFEHITEWDCGRFAGCLKTAAVISSASDTKLYQSIFLWFREAFCFFRR